MITIAADTALGHLQAALSHAELDTLVVSDVGDAAIVNVFKDGVYLYTLTLTRTPGYGGEFAETIEALNSNPADPNRILDERLPFPASAA